MELLFFLGLFLLPWLLLRTYRAGKRTGSIRGFHAGRRRRRF